MAAKPWSKTIITPEGTALYPRLTEPDARFGEPRYEVTIKFTGEEAEAIKAQLEALAVEALAQQADFDPKFKKLKALALPLKPVMDDEGNEVEGEYTMQCKAKAFITTKQGATIPNKPALVDAKKNPIDVAVWGGSKIKVAVQLIPFSTFGGGLSARMKGVQVLELVTATGAAGMFDVEDGFEAAESQVFSTKAVPAKEEDEAEDIDF